MVTDTLSAVRPKVKKAESSLRQNDTGKALDGKGLDLDLPKKICCTPVNKSRQPWFTN